MDSDNIWEIVNFYFKEFVLFKIQDVSITISHITIALVTIFLSFLFSRIVQSLLKNHLFKKINIEQGLEYALLRFVHYSIIILGLYVGLTTINIPLGAILGLFAVIGVGIGFGLQNITSNFISGIILLIERPIKVGDRVEVNEVWGDVKKINLRTTLVETPDNITIIVPNSKLLENDVINYSYGDPRIRLRVPIGVAYGSDCEKITEILLNVADENTNVLKNPKPKIWFREFGDSSLNFLLLCWIPSASEKFNVISEINYSIDKMFRKNGIEIPFPQRDVHVRTDERIK